MAYNRSIPQSTDLLSNNQSQILGNFQAIDSGTTGTGIGFSRNHITMTDATNGGLHNRIDFYQAVSSPSVSGFASSLYPFTVTNTEVYYKNTSVDIPITNTLLTAASGQGMMPGGLQVRCGSGNSGGTKTVSISFGVNFPTACLSVVSTAEGTDTTQNCIPGAANTSGFTLTTSKTNLTYYWIAIGY